VRPPLNYNVDNRTVIKQLLVLLVSINYDVIILNICKVSILPERPLRRPQMIRQRPPPNLFKDNQQNVLYMKLLSRFELAYFETSTVKYFY